MKKISSTLLVLAFATGCYARSTVNTPVGVKTNTMIAGGLVSVSNVDTKTSFEQDCRAWLKPGLPADPVTGRPADMALPDRSIYATCFANHMQPVDPMGQQSAPIPTDVNGDGMPDYFQYGGFYIPAHIVNAYGIPGYAGPIGYGGMSYYGTPGMQFPGASISNIDGSSMDPRTYANAAQATPQQPGKPQIASPWNGTSGNEPTVTAEDMRGVLKQMKQTQRDLDALRGRTQKVGTQLETK